jgi:excisionase family DNA binding protein
MQQENTNQKPLAVSIKQVCRLLGLSRWTVSRMVKHGVLRSRRIGSRVLIPITSVEDFLKG